MGLLHLLELEEQVGMIWHRMVGDRASYADHPDAAVTLAEVRPMLGVFFHALGGPRHVEVAAQSGAESTHRLSWRQRLGMATERLVPAALSETTLKLPDRIALYPDAALNRDLYLWLAAFLAVAEAPDPDDAPLRADLRAIAMAQLATRRTLEAYPGLAARYRALADGLLAQRPTHRRPPVEMAVEAAVRTVLAGEDPALDLPRSAPHGYRPFLPVPLWGRIEAATTGVRPPDENADPASSQGKEDERKRKASRKSFDQSERDDPLILNRFEKILSLAEMVNVNRSVEDEDEEDARKAADDLDEIAITQHKRKAATRLRLDLDLPPEANVGGALGGGATYPEWDYRRQILMPNHCRVITEVASEEGADWEPDNAARRLIHRVRRQFEALRPRQVTFRRQADGDDLDLEALVRARCDKVATGETSDLVYQKTRAIARDLSVAVLADVSLSTDAWINDRRVLDVEKEALSVFLSGLAACGDENAVFTFTSRRRDWVRVQTVKGFDETFGPRVLRRIAALRPGYYTRIGAAVRHTAAQLEKRPHKHRLLLLLTDGKPNDIDHYEGRFGIEDTRRAILEARRKGITVFGVTIDRTAQDYFPALFGRGGFAIVGDLSRLSRALPRIYQSLSG
jgi:nitric oxide reductase NorD protein